jgi:hypothetical protein
LQCAALMIERTQRAAVESVDGDGLLWSIATYVQTFPRVHLLRLWTPTIFQPKFLLPLGLWQPSCILVMLCEYQDNRLKIPNSIYRP